MRPHRLPNEVPPRIQGRPFGAALFHDVSYVPRRRRRYFRMVAAGVYWISRLGRASRSHVLPRN